ncbi:thioredoxin-like protein [Dacryopinax primogenitus]|uniref:Thioredoxin-like protein n=1 Tax=Dacryopinax primogenitus (strain DJM 731) TaxID=1858805 RepID=M5G9Y7_DACPD|nr:thioredoxin-like protein [Dacryopinax primogenitus]EJU05634.1 thioredoxin-like protein [Dacryopinax primogenitus]
MSIFAASRRLPTALSSSRLATRSFASTSRKLERFENADVNVFKKRVMDEGSSKLMIVDFYAAWCGPCRMLSPLLEKLTTDTTLTNGKEVDLMTVDVDKQTQLAGMFQVTSLPTVIIFKDKKAVQRFVGFIPMPKLQQIVAEAADI